MAYEQRDDSGALFKNETSNASAPQYKGDALIGGVPHWVSAWVKESAKGVKYMSLAFDVKEEKVEKPDEPSQPLRADDDLPF